MAAWEKDCCGVLDFLSKRYERMIKECLDRNLHIAKQQKQFESDFGKDQVKGRRDKWIKENNIQ